MQPLTRFTLVAVVVVAAVSAASAEDSWFGKREPDVATAIDAGACFSRAEPVCTDVMCMKVMDCGFGLDFYPKDHADNQFAHLTYTLDSVTHKQADGTVVKTVSRADFLACVDGDSFLTPPSTSVALNVTCALDKYDYTWSTPDRYSLTEQSIVAASADESHTLYDTDGTTELFSWTLEKGAAKLSWSLDWMVTAATESDMVTRQDTDTFEVKTKLQWKIPTTFNDVLNSGITQIPSSFSPDSFGKITKDEGGSIVTAEADAFVKSKVVLIPYVKVCGHTGGAVDDFPCVNKRIHTDGEFGDHVSLSGGVSAPTSLLVTQSWTGVGPRMDMDPTFKVEEGQFLGGSLNFKLFFILGVAVLGLIIVCCCLCCCYCCCKKKKGKTAPVGNDPNVPQQVYH